MAVPAFVQHICSSYDEPAIHGVAGNNYVFTLPNLVQAGNCLVLNVTYDSGVTVSSITDSTGDTWSTTAAASTNSGSLISAAFVRPNATAGATTLTFTFNTTVQVFHYTCTEITNIATSTPVETSSVANNVTAPNLASGNLTTAVDGDFILSYYFCSAASQSNVSSWVPGTNFTLLNADRSWFNNQGAPHALEYWVQPTHGTVNPGITASGVTNGYNCVSIALKAAAAGNPRPAGIYVNKILWMNGQFVGGAGTVTVQVPMTGNLRVVTTDARSNDGVITGITDSDSNTWVDISPGTNDNAYVWYAKNTTANTALTVTITMSSHSAGLNPLLSFYDVSGATSNPYDVTAAFAPASTNAGVVDNAPTITPTINAPGLSIATWGAGTGGNVGFDTGAPAGAFNDTVNYTNKNDGSEFDHGSGRAHVFYTTNASLHWNWTFPATVGNTVWADSVTFNAAPVSPPSVPSVPFGIIGLGSSEW